MHHDLSGQTLNGFKLLRRIGSKKQKSVYEFICICGKLRTNTLDYIRRFNKTKAQYCRCKDNRDSYQICLNQLFWRYKLGSTARRNQNRFIKFDISVDDFEKLITSNCYYCDNPPSNCITVTKRHIMFYSGLDRLDNSKEYTKDNCVSCCWDCNQKKRNTNKEEFVNWVVKVYNNLMFKSQISAEEKKE